MNARKLGLHGFLSAGIIISLLGTESISSAAPTETGTNTTSSIPAARANPNIPLETIESLPELIQNDPTIHIDPSIEPGMPLVYSETGKPVPGQSPEELAAAATCLRTVTAPVGGYWLKYDSPCGFIGTSAYSTLTYTKSTNPYSSGTGCWQGRGYSTNNTETWTGMGCIDGSYTVHWGNVASVPSVKVSAIGTVGYSGAFSH